ncbi:hypothetical protein KIN20_019590 [Parelaphostrongylus tenuis]|uniref:Uncharacterized protein n=1 Tax=Parelaphostrongylus tenuis TaxID=148309 RepID=A0AAD5MLF1_PARTN|nr:hypothetical protein KIN20_019590 [Parelaphostrongylus tenuis]
MALAVGSAATIEVARGDGSPRASKGPKPNASSRLAYRVCVGSYSIRWVYSFGRCVGPFAIHYDTLLIQQSVLLTYHPS